MKTEDMSSPSVMYPTTFWMMSRFCRASEALLLDSSRSAALISRSVCQSGSHAHFCWRVRPWMVIICTPASSARFASSLFVFLAASCASRACSPLSRDMALVLAAASRLALV